MIQNLFTAYVFLEGQFQEALQIRAELLIELALAILDFWEAMEIWFKSVEAVMLIWITPAGSTTGHKDKEDNADLSYVWTLEKLCFILCYLWIDFFSHWSH